MIATKKKRLPANNFFTSILLALFADTKIINRIVLEAKPTLAGSFMTAMYAVCVIGLLYMGLIHQKKSFGQLSFSHMVVCIICVLWYYATFALVGEPSVSVSFFWIFMVASFIIPGLVTIEFKTFLMTLFILPSVGIFYIDQIFIRSVAEEGVLSMGVSYALLVPVLANLIYLKYFFLSENRSIKLVILPFTAINIFYLVQMTMFGSRGPLFCVILLIASFFIFKINGDSKITINRRRLSLLIIGAFIVYVCFLQLLQLISDFLSDYGISLNTVEKFLRMQENGDMSNGRDAISKVVWEGILNSPIVGHGTSQFENNTGIVYPHNFILQMLYDGGLVLTLCIFVPIVKSLIKKFRNINKHELICFVLLFFSSVPGALFSGDLWQANILWLFFGFLLAKDSLIYDSIYE